ncbi:MFS transporter [Ehrlichia ruminantium]|uniref:MFS transporter n=1 Tax=Ehrlichia ruminantium TaxID=779 RepID=A0AAE6UL50_EHRRU|nr:MFS transporter [Ehrlichia ruminantium]QGR02361.1 MFS transporter [Ehrlichia ruminantium]QGR03898.1 MFS transporter [Ehrlichia ruminantium]QGR04205.1 MFS transporter [Ehrlichia ruminantium]
MLSKISVRSALAVLLCAFIECYDFLLYGNFSRVFSKLFFSHISETLSLILALVIFAITFFVRPFGSVLFGYIGDKYGRRISLFISAVILIVSVGGVAFLPLFNSIGILSPILLVLLRTFQGLSFGGEVGAIVLIAESVKKDQVILMLCAHFMIAILGGAAGYFIFKVCYNLIPEAEFYSWGWRIPFIVGLFMAMMLPILRRSIEESSQYLHYKNSQRISKVPVLDIVLYHKKFFIMICSIVGSSNSLFYMFFVFLNVQQPVSIITYSFLTLTVLVCGLISFFLYKRYKPESVAIIFQILFITCVSPIVCYFGFKSLVTYFIFAASLGIYSTPILSVVIFLFPVNVRQTGFSFSYSVAVAVFGGTAPAICLWLTEVTGLSISPIFYLDGCSLLALGSLFFLKRYNVITQRHSNVSVPY